MLSPALPINPPTSVPGPFRQAKLPPSVPTQRLPQHRFHTASGTDTLAGLAERFYANPKEAVRIFNANRFGMLRDDRATGMLRSLQDIPPAGTVLLIP